MEPLKKNKSFRLWCSDKWYEHKDEIETWTKKNPSYNMEYYFNKYKWWLKAKFKEEVYEKSIKSE